MNTKIIKIAQANTKLDAKELLNMWKNRNINSDYVDYRAMANDLDYNRGLSLEAAKPKVPKLNDFKKSILLGLAIVSTSVFADAIIKFFNKQYKQYKSKEYFEKMLEAHPQLQKEDPIKVAKYWESLYHFAPHMAEDPLAAGAYITQSLNRMSGEEFGGPPPDTISTLADIQKKSKEGLLTSKPGATDKARDEYMSQLVRQVYNT